MVSRGTPIPMELVNPTLRDNQNLTHPMEDWGHIFECNRQRGKLPGAMDLDRARVVLLGTEAAKEHRRFWNADRNL
ncbi:hypothetical protein F5Y09DRAFT_304309 [Xylaria sp. FL1042]|nr:hypothetical protein F5Y09DRAFT_304309 [Xylaria sp. FL1042]